MANDRTAVWKEYLAIMSGLTAADERDERDKAEYLRMVQQIKDRQAQRQTLMEVRYYNRARILAFILTEPRRRRTDSPRG